MCIKKYKTKNKVLEPYLKEKFGEVEKLSEIASEITFMIPKEKRSIFQEFFKEFDEKKEELDIKSYGISITTLEEVFLAVNAEDRDPDDPLNKLELLDRADREEYEEQVAMEDEDSIVEERIRTGSLNSETAKNPEK